VAEDRLAIVAWHLKVLLYSARPRGHSTSGVLLGAERPLWHAVTSPEARFLWAGCWDYSAGVGLWWEMSLSSVD